MLNSRTWSRHSQRQSPGPSKPGRRPSSAGARNSPDAVQPGFLIYVPVYAGGIPPTDVEGRRAALLGFAAGAKDADPEYLKEVIAR